MHGREVLMNNVNKTVQNETDDNKLTLTQIYNFVKITIALQLIYFHFTDKDIACHILYIFGIRTQF